MSVANLLDDGGEPQSWANLNVNSLKALDVETDVLTVVGGIDADLLKGVPISAVPPVATEVLTYNGTQWAPAAGGGGGSTVYSPTTQDLYISTLGNDASDGLSAVNAVQTWNRLLTVASEFNVDEIIIHLVEGQILGALASTLNTPIQEYEETNLNTITHIWDFSPIGSSNIKVVTDLASPTILTPSASGIWSTTVGLNNFIYFDHSSLTGLVGSNRWLYRADTDQYYSTDFLQNGSTRTYCINWDSTITPYTFYDDSQIATLNFEDIVLLINAPNKSVVFERLAINTFGVKLNGDLVFKGCSFNNVSKGTFLSGYELLLDSCYIQDIRLYDGFCNLNFCYSDSLVGFQRNSIGNMSYCYLDTFDVYNNNTVKAYKTEFIGGNTEVANNSRITLTHCGATNNTFYAYGGSNIRIIFGIFQENLFNMEQNSKLTISNMSATCAVQLLAQSGSQIYVTGCNLTSRGGIDRICKADEMSTITIEGGTIADVIAGIPSANPMFEALDFSIIDIKSNAINTVCNRTGTLVNAVNGSKIWLPGFTVSSALTSNDLINADQNSEIYLTAATQMNTTQNMIHVQGASKILSTVTPTNLGSANVLKKGTTAAGAWAFSTTYAALATATDEMCLVLAI